jgi:hypothetical protein
MELEAEARLFFTKSDTIAALIAVPTRIKKT